VNRDAFKDMLAAVTKAIEDGALIELPSQTPLGIRFAPVPPTHINCRCAAKDEMEPTVELRRTSDGKWAVPKALRGGKRGKQK
jgi:hypothetical protein